MREPEFQRAITNFKEFMEFKDTHTFSEIKAKEFKENKDFSDAKKKKNTNVRLKEKNEDNPKLVNVIQ